MTFSESAYTIPSKDFGDSRKAKRGIMTRTGYRHEPRERGSVTRGKTYSMHLDGRVVDSADALVRDGEFMSRSQLVETAIRELLAERGIDPTEDALEVAR